MVTSGTSRQSSRPASVAGLASSASRSAAGENACGMSWEWIAIRLTAFSVASEPSRSLTLPEARPKPRLRTRSTLTRSPSSAPLRSALAMFSSRPACFLSTGTSRPPPSGRAAKDAEHAGLGVIDDLDDAAAIGAPSPSAASIRSSARSPTPAAVPGCGAARHMDADFRRLAALDLVPFGRRGDQFAVAVAAGDVHHQRRRQRRRLLDLAAVLLDGAVVGQFAQDPFQLDAVGVLQAEFARDLAGADFARIGADERDEGVPVGKAALALSCSHL